VRRFTQSMNVVAVGAANVIFTRSHRLDDASGDAPDRCTNGQSQTFAPINVSAHLSSNKNPN